MKIGFVSLGCPKNQLDAEVMLHELVMAGYELTADETEADVVIINTCGFIESAKKEAIDNILDIAWLKENRDLKGLIVTGCLAERYRNSILEELEVFTTLWKRLARCLRVKNTPRLRIKTVCALAVTEF